VWVTTSKKSPHGFIDHVITSTYASIQSNKTLSFISRTQIDNSNKYSTTRLELVLLPLLGSTRNRVGPSGRTVLSMMQWSWFRPGIPDDQRQSQYQQDVMAHQHVAIGGIDSKMELDTRWSAASEVVSSYRPRGTRRKSTMLWMTMLYSASPVSRLRRTKSRTLLWDDFLPAHALLRLFALLQHHQLRPTALHRDRWTRPSWASCDSNSENFHKCHDMYVKFLPLLGLDD
jgi:hypothetical protein